VLAQSSHLSLRQGSGLSDSRSQRTQSFRRSLITLFRSKLEAFLWDGIRKRCKKKKLKPSYESVKLPYYLAKVYLPDFVIQRPDGSTFYIEAKGYLRSSDRTKLLAIKEQGHDLRMIFSQDNKLTAKSKTRYSDWCKKNDIPYSINSVPIEWFE
jgi:predicted nuclease of restriction endonuclease-like RecB superfamily